MRKYKYCIFYKSNGKWLGPLKDEFLSKEDIIYDSGLDSEDYAFKLHAENYLKNVRKWLRKPVQWRVQTFSRIYL